MTIEKENLIKEFKKISKKRWIKGIRKDHGSIGLTFENELNKEPDALFLPDWEGIEIKCTSNYSKYPLYLFTIAFDGPTFPEINRLIDLYGHSDKDYPDKKVLFSKLSHSKFNIVLNKYYFKLQIDEDKLFLLVYDLNYKLIEKKSFVYIKSIKDHLTTKLNDMAIINAYKKNIDNQICFRYHKITLYTLKPFEEFLELLRYGIINVELIARINKSGIDEGKYRNKNLVFSIKKENIEMLFNKEYQLDMDNKSNFYFYPGIKQ